ncbi:MAG TPA: hydantoinase/oxoprolinase family protein, partial [Armatimonadaceae bacterium]|nr:hydantoinase/oxoprolinase family protein [Armatimonadaceae bacterium]
MGESDAGSVQKPEQLWRVWADTGGTFTDCLGVAPGAAAGGALRRAKVLSAGVLRAALRGVADAAGRVLLVREQWSGGEDSPLPRDFVAGLTLRLPGEDAPAATIVRYEPPAAPGDGDSRIEIDRPFPAGSDITPGALLEVVWPEEAPVVGAHLLTRTPYGAPLPPMALRVATTRGTNALLTRRGTPPALFVTRGFADLLEIGTQQRPDLFALDIVKPAALYGAVAEVQERLAADGSVLRPLDEDALREAARALRARGFATAAVALLHADRNDAHEARAAAILREAGFSHVSRSADLAPFIKVLPRAQTAVVNAYLSPVIDAYVGGLTAAAETLHLMTSAGGLVGAGAFRPKDSLLSGPAGGVVGAARAARLSGHPRLIAFDMGGTSTDVARCDAAQGYDYVFEHRVGDAHLVTPALAIESVAAGGGSVCFVERRGLRVGPESAGASPGPACYGAGGPLTVTDVNLLLGRLDPARFEIPIDRAAAEAAADALLAALERETGERMTREALLAGFLDVANERMADAIRTVSVRRGYDPAEHALVAFGGAGGQHACAVAERLGIPTVLVPRDAGLLSALGIGHAPVERFAERQVLAAVTPETDAAAGRMFAELAEEAVAAVAEEDVAARAEIGVRRRIAALRLVGQESALEVEYVPDGPPLADLFAARFAAVFGYRPDPSRVVEVVSLRVVAGSNEGGPAP